MSKEKQIIRPPALAGSWYDSDAETLRRRVTDFLNNAKIAPLPDAFGFVVPHAGHRYSGQCAAYAYKAVSGRSFNRVILLGTNHQPYRFKGVAVTTMTHYQTPLGLIAVDTAACRKLLDKSGLFVTALDAEASEHSLEIQLPFLQVTLKEFKLVPLMVDGLSANDYITASETIKEIIDDQTLILASSDFTHYGQGFGYIPFKDNIKENLRKLDDGAIKEILSISPQGFLKYLADTEITICGYGPITLLLNLVPPGTTTTLLNYYTSGDLTGDFTHSVSYAAIGFSPDAKVGTPRL
jgi:AmmeMemoRadiSam system protein B